jgi:low affinity Fe/Cu permease
VRSHVVGHIADVRKLFDRFAGASSERAGSPWAFATAVFVLALWAISGPLFGFSDTWQLIINTGTTIVTFLMVFLLQHTQNKDAHALRIKLDTLIAATRSASNRMIDIENLDDEELEKMRQRFQELAATSPRFGDERAEQNEIRGSAELSGRSPS